MNPTSELHGEDFEELAAGFSLGALDEADNARFRAHLPHCRRCRTLVADYQAVAARLPESLEGMEASPGLRSRLLEAARAERPESPAAHRFPVPYEAHLQQRDPAPRRQAPLWALPLAALFAVTLWLGYSNHRLEQQLAQEAASQQLQQQVLEALAAGGRSWALQSGDQAFAGSGFVLQDPNHQLPLLVLHGLPELPSHQAYQAWVIAGGTPIDAGVIQPGPGGQRVARLAAPLGNAEAVALTIEPAGGARSPSGPIVLQARV